MAKDIVVIAVETVQDNKKLCWLLFAGIDWAQMGP
jgi:hypothetical protein